MQTEAHVQALVKLSENSKKTVFFFLGGVHPGRLTWNIIMEVWKMIFLLIWVFFGSMLIFQGVVRTKETKNKFQLWHFMDSLLRVCSWYLKISTRLVLFGKRSGKIAGMEYEESAATRTWTRIHQENQPAMLGRTTDTPKWRFNSLLPLNYSTPYMLFLPYSWFSGTWVPQIVVTFQILRESSG